LKIGTVVVLNSLSKPTDFGFKRSRVRVKVRVVACGSKIMPKCGRCHRIIHLHLYNALLNENVKRYFCDTSYNSWPTV